MRRGMVALERERRTTPPDLGTQPLSTLVSDDGSSPSLTVLNNKGSATRCLGAAVSAEGACKLPPSHITLTGCSCFEGDKHRVKSKLPRATRGHVLGCAIDMDTPNGPTMVYYADGTKLAGLPYGGTIEDLQDGLIVVCIWLVHKL